MSGRGAPLRLVAAALALALAACGGPQGPTEVALEDLVADQEVHDGEVVVVEGVVRSYEDPLHYWIEDEAVNRVELVPHESVADRVGERVRVRGEYGFAEDRGRVITVDELDPLEDAATAPAGRASLA